MNGFCPCSGVC